MKNRNVGFLIIGVAVVIAIVVFLFNTALTNIVNTSCSHGPTCPMYGEIKSQTYISIAIIGFVLIIGLVLIFGKENEKIVVKKVRPYTDAELKPRKFNKESLENLGSEEKQIMNLLLESQGSAYQSAIAEKTGMNKVKVTRILDSLEAQGLVERKKKRHDQYRHDKKLKNETSEIFTNSDF